jgi:hypothetical protein
MLLRSPSSIAQVGGERNTQANNGYAQPNPSDQQSSLSYSGTGPVRSHLHMNFSLRRGLRLKDGPGSARAATVSVGLRWGFTLSPSARTGPSRLGPAGEGRSDGGVLHLRPRGQARYPEGGRRREDEPLREGWRIRASTEETSSTRATSTWRTVHAGARAPVPPCMARSPRFFTPYRPSRTRQDLPCTSAGEPRTL